jgi:glycosyltransferase involved in cell wall biosynthesis
MNNLGLVINRAKKKEKLNILSISTHESHDSTFAKTGHNIYLLELDGFKRWNTTFRVVPPNVTLLKNGIIPTELDIDLVISQNKFDQPRVLYPIAQQYNIPLIDITHTFPFPDWPKSQLKQLNNIRGDINVFITEHSRQAWGFTDQNSIVIEHGFDTECFSPTSDIERQPYILSVCNQFNKPVRFAPCGYPVWEKVIGLGSKEELPWGLLGDQTEPLGVPTKNLDDLIGHYRKAQVFLNTSLLSPIPMSVLEAASCALPIVSTKTCAIPDIFTHEENALLSNDPNELRDFCKQLLNDKALREKLGNNARNLIYQRFNMERYLNDWNILINKLV